MNKFKISQIQFQAKPSPQENADLLEDFFIKAQKYNPDLICTPECSNLITNDRKHLFSYATYQNDCPVINKAKIFAKKNKVNINLGSLLLKIKNSKKLVNRSILINSGGKIQSTYDKIHLFDVNINSKEKHKESQSFVKGKELAISKLMELKLDLLFVMTLDSQNYIDSLLKKERR